MEMLRTQLLGVAEPAGVAMDAVREAFENVRKMNKKLIAQADGMLIEKGHLVCEPVEENRSKSKTWHWVWIAADHESSLAQWAEVNGEWGWLFGFDFLSPQEAGNYEWKYIAPLDSHACLVKEIDLHRLKSLQSMRYASQLESALSDVLKWQATDETYREIGVDPLGPRAAFGFAQSLLNRRG